MSDKKLNKDAVLKKGKGIFSDFKDFISQGDVLDLAASEGVVSKSGAWYAYEGTKIGQGRENAKAYLKENPAVFDEIEKKVRERFSLETIPQEENDTEELLDEE